MKSITVPIYFFDFPNFKKKVMGEKFYKNADIILTINRSSQGNPKIKIIRNSWKKDQ